MWDTLILLELFFKYETERVNAMELLGYTEILESLWSGFPKCFHKNSGTLH